MTNCSFLVMNSSRANSSARWPNRLIYRKIMAEDFGLGKIRDRIACYTSKRIRLRAVLRWAEPGKNKKRKARA